MEFNWTPAFYAGALEGFREEIEKAAPYLSERIMRALEGRARQWEMCIQDLELALRDVKSQE